MNKSFGVIDLSKDVVLRFKSGRPNVVGSYSNRKFPDNRNKGAGGSGKNKLFR